MFARRACSQKQHLKRFQESATQDKGIRFTQGRNVCSLVNSW